VDDLNIVSHEIKPRLQSYKFDISKVPLMERVEIELYKVLSDCSGAVREMCGHIMSAGGKRIRPLLVIYSGLVFSDLTDEMIQTALAAELIHMASLVHDDIIDNSSLRRSKPSVNKVWGSHFAVLCGDYLFAKAFGILSGMRLIKSMNHMVEAIQNMCCGEIIQAGDRFERDISIEKYYDKIMKKTAVFLACCCKSGAFLGGATELQVQLLGEYGMNMGLAFQIIDDILDFCGDVNVMGKPKGEDIRQGNITLPLILLLRDKRYGNVFSEMMLNNELSETALDKISDILKKSGSITEAFDMAAGHIEKAKQCLDMLPESEHVQFLLKLADMLQARIN